MKRKTRQFLKIFATGASLTLVVSFMGQGCQNGFEAAKDGLGTITGSSSGGGSGSSSGSSVQLPSDFLPKTEAKTTSLVYSRQILDHLLSCSGVGNADTKIKAEYENRKGTLSEYGYATEVTAPMLMGVTAVAGEICNKLIEQEAMQLASARNVFNTVNFSSGPAQLNKNSEFQEVVRRLARSCWGRNETAEELDIIYNNFSEDFNSSTDGNRTKAGMLSVCTAMLSSVSAIEI